MLQENASLNYEETAAFTFQIHAEDGHTTSATTYVTLQITDVNEPPVSRQTRLFIQAQKAKVHSVYFVKCLLVIYLCGSNFTFTYLYFNVNIAHPKVRCSHVQLVTTVCDSQGSSCFQ